MTQLTDPQGQLMGFDYDPEGSLIETTLPNGVTTTSTFDGGGRMLATSSERLGTVLQSFDYAYDAAGNRTSETNRSNDTTTYAYDALNRLTEWDPPADPPVAYAYDAAGNRTQAGSVTSTFNALNQLTGSSDGTSYVYDGAGRMTERTNGSQTATYSWDALDQLLEVDDGANPVSYSYDALGRRSERSEGSTTEAAHYGDFADLAILDTDASGIIRGYVQGPGGLVEERDSATGFPLAEAHGDVTAITDADGGVTSRHSYDPWGGRLSGPELEFGWLGAQQRRADPATGLLQMGIRGYDPGLGRFVSEDPVLATRGLGQSVDRYAYALDNPVNLYDLSGRWFGDDIWDATAPVRGTVEELVTDPGGAATRAVNYWANSDSPAANLFGPLSMVGEMTTHRGRIDDYLKGCSRWQMLAGGLATSLSVPFIAFGSEHLIAAEAAAKAGNLSLAFGAGSAGAGQLSMGSGALILGPSILRQAC